MELSDILVRPLVTEKSTTTLGTDRTYAFEVGIDANKIQIRTAIESFYGVAVEDVRTMVVRDDCGEERAHLAAPRLIAVALHERRRVHLLAIVVFGGESIVRQPVVEIRRVPHARKPPARAYHRFAGGVARALIAGGGGMSGLTLQSGQRRVLPRCASASHL